jgi:glycosyltransferase involved in cell wall biosynthesis
MKITVAVPTIEGRARYLASCLQTCVAQDADFEILVSDNPGGEARDVVASFNDSRIRYVRPPRYLPMAAHFEFVLGQVSGDYLTYIGDDDGLMPGCIERVLGIRSEVGDKVIHHALANYYWPDHLEPALRNQVVFLDPVGKGQRAVQSEDFLRGVASASARYIEGPMVYHNFVPLSVIRRASRSGRFFQRAAPDVYSAVAIAMNEPQYCSTDELLTIGGQGAKANGAAVQSGQADLFLAEMQAQYTPRFGGRTVQMALLDCLVAAAELFDRPDILASIDHVAQYARMVRESRRMMKGRPRISEYRNAFVYAKNQGVLVRTVLALAEGKLRRSRPAPGVVGRDTDHVTESGEMVRLPESVRDISSASLAIGAMLAEREAAS